MHLMISSSIKSQEAPSRRAPYNARELKESMHACMHARVHIRTCLLTLDPDVHACMHGACMVRMRLLTQCTVICLLMTPRLHIE